MTTPSSDPGMSVLGAILPGRHDLLEDALRRLRPEHFTGQVLPGLFSYLSNYMGQTGEVAKRQALQWTLQSTRTLAGSEHMYLEAWDLLCSMEVSDGEFTTAVDTLRSRASERATGEALSEAYHILNKPPARRDRPALRLPARTRWRSSPRLTLT